MYVAITLEYEVKSLNPGKNSLAESEASSAIILINHPRGKVPVVVTLELSTNLTDKNFAKYISMHLFMHYTCVHMRACACACARVIIVHIYIYIYIYIYNIICIYVYPGYIYML